MTIRKLNNFNYDIGNLLYDYRKRLTDLPKSRRGFIDNRSKAYFNGEEWISEKTLINYENGKNVPSLQNLKKLALALEVDESELVAEILKLI
ncbi:helix-turn-helix domain-containing protein [Streptococcus sobrinus]|uniref:helix-turn-helix domain-containing protein n=1 Tax=Streptococcus sobrinus TaxID=1310 RepID=UPI0003802F77|nr:helix-turn-helix transcriptional regulator [Streptococcus sobrinus]AWN18010.1 XRE family transcriptional regulator [Streptococcus sobrinus]